MNTETKPKIALTNIHLTRDTWRDKGTLSGSATFSSIGRNNARDESVEIKIKLSLDEVAKIVQICGDSLKTAAQKQAQAFYEDAAAQVGLLLENREIKDEDR